MSWTDTRKGLVSQGDKMSYRLLLGHLPLVLPERATLRCVLQHQPEDIRSADIRPKGPDQISFTLRAQDSSYFPWGFHSSTFGKDKYVPQDAEMGNKESLLGSLRTLEQDFLKFTAPVGTHSGPLRPHDNVSTVQPIVPHPAWSNG